MCWSGILKCKGWAHCVIKITKLPFRRLYPFRPPWKYFPMLFVTNLIGYKWMSHFKVASFFYSFHITDSLYALMLWLWKAGLCMCTSLCAYVCVNTRVCMCMGVCGHVCMCMYVLPGASVLYAHVYTCACVCCMCVCVHACVAVWGCTRVCVCTVCFLASTPAGEHHDTVWVMIAWTFF